MATGGEPSPPWTDEQMHKDDVSKKDLVTFLQENGAKKFLKEHKVFGKIASIAKGSKKDHLIATYHKLFETKAFKTGDDDDEDEDVAAVTAKAAEVTVSEKTEEAAAPEKPHYTKQVMKKGDGKTIPRKGDTVACNYTGTLDDGTVFDTNLGKKKRGKKGGNEPLKFRVGVGKVIRGWDEALMTMSLGEKAKLVIQPDWAYGKKGLPDNKIPPNATLTFEVELVSVE